MPSTTILSPAALTPWENPNGIWFKREDYHRNAYGVNGAKYRVCRYMIANALAYGARHIITAQSVRSPQAAISATLAEEFEVPCTVVVGASKPETAVRHRSISIAVASGAELDTTPRIAYNGVIQPYGAKLAASIPGGWQVPYAISPPADSSRDYVETVLDQGGWQTQNLPDKVETLVIPFGSGNSTAGIFYGLSKYGCKNLKRVVLVGVGPDRTQWLKERLNYVDVYPEELPFHIDHYPLHGWFAEYADLMPETLDGIVLHPTYEGKVARFLNMDNPGWWAKRDGSVGFWIVGGPF